MRHINIITLVIAGLSFSPLSLAFTAIAKMNSEELHAMAKRFVNNPQKRQVQIPTVGRKKIPDADHPYQAPSATAQRGPCPGLNIMANYGYIDREGIASFSELVYGQQEAMGWAPGLAILLASIAIAVDGNTVTQLVSIGGPDDHVGTLTLVGGQIPGGILKHNSYEIDSSLTRDDVAIVSNELNGGVVNAPVMIQVRSNRYEASARDDPSFIFPPIGVSCLGADHFLWNTMVSSDETGEPEPCNRTTLSGFYGAKSTGPDTWEYVPDQFPGEEWYRRARPLTIAELVENAITTPINAAEKGQLPTGITTTSFASADAFTCALKSIVTDQVPASLASIGAVSSFLTNLGTLGSIC